MEEERRLGAAEGAGGGTGGGIFEGSESGAAVGAVTWDRALEEGWSWWEMKWGAEEKAVGVAR